MPEEGDREDGKSDGRSGAVVATGGGEGEEEDGDGEVIVDAPWVSQ